MQPPLPPAVPAGTDWQMVGSLADWSTAGIALLAFVIAAIAARATLKTNNAQQAQLAMQIDQQKYAQASQVTFWFDETQKETSALNILNASQLPIYSVGLFVQDDEEMQCRWYSRICVPTSGKNQTTTVFMDKTVQTMSTSMLGFRDSGGQFWTRDRWGKLLPMTDDEVRDGPIELAVIHYFGGEVHSSPQSHE